MNESQKNCAQNMACREMAAYKAGCMKTLDDIKKWKCINCKYCNRDNHYCEKIDSILIYNIPACTFFKLK